MQFVMKLLQIAGSRRPKHLKVTFFSFTKMRYLMALDTCANFVAKNFFDKTDFKNMFKLLIQMMPVVQLLVSIDFNS